MNNRYLDPEQKFYNYHTSEVDGVNIFDINKASNSWSQNFIDDPKYMLKEENMQMHIEHMSPREYWERCARDVFNKPVNQLLNQWRTLDSNTLEHLQQVILKYKKRFPITYINYASYTHPSQEGLHRMIVAGDLFGWDTKFPVMIIEWADKDKAESEKINIRNNKINNYIDRAVNRILNYKYNNIDELKDQLYSEIEYELKYDDEFENKSFNLDLTRNDQNTGFNVIVNDRYTSFIDDVDINLISDASLYDLDDDVSDYLFEKLDHVESYLTSKLLLSEISEIFGDDYYKKPLCKEVCEFVKSKCPSCELLEFAISVWKLSDYELEPISVKGHCVIRYDNKIYDYTSEQYSNYHISKAESQPRILNYSDKLSKALAAEIYVDNDYIVAI